RANKESSAKVCCRKCITVFSGSRSQGWQPRAIWPHRIRLLVVRQIGNSKLRSSKSLNIPCSGNGSETLRGQNISVRQDTFGELHPERLLRLFVSAWPLSNAL